jgi:CRISPR-associated protein Cmr1
VQRTYDIELITPMVGGGATAGKVDTDFPIRPTAIRGHLRYWWRMVRGHLLGDGMWRREEEIFGSTEFPSPVTVIVEALTQVEQFNPADNQNRDPFDPVAYALFASIENKHQITREGLRIRISVLAANSVELARRRKAQNEKRSKASQPVLDPSIVAIDDDITSALSAWLMFGGIGGRTRRGCGAVHCRNVGDAIPKLPAKVFVGPAQSSALEAWKKALEAYREFRQTPRGKVHQKTIQTRNGPKTIQVPGRSHWPEADSIRQITGCALKPPHGTPPSGVPTDEDTRDHSTPVIPGKLLPAFPKAVLGLPINFHFADGPQKNQPASANLDPKDVQLCPVLPDRDGRMEKAERMASPIITRPLWMNGKWLPAIIILDSCLPKSMQVRVEGRNASLTGDLVHDLPLNRVIDPSLGAIEPMRGKSSAIEALIDFLRSRRFEVTR